MQILQKIFTPHILTIQQTAIAVCVMLLILEIDQYRRQETTTSPWIHAGEIILMLLLTGSTLAALVSNGQGNPAGLTLSRDKNILFIQVSDFLSRPHLFFHASSWLYAIYHLVRSWKDPANDNRSRLRSIFSLIILISLLICGLGMRDALEAFRDVPFDRSVEGFYRFRIPLISIITFLLGHLLSLLPYADILAALIATPEDSRRKQFFAPYFAIAWICLLFGLSSTAFIAHRAVGWDAYWLQSPTTLSSFILLFLLTATLLVLIVEHNCHITIRALYPLSLTTAASSFYAVAIIFSGKFGLITTPAITRTALFGVMSFAALSITALIVFFNKRSVLPNITHSNEYAAMRKLDRLLTRESFLFGMASIALLAAVFCFIGTAAILYFPADSANKFIASISYYQLTMGPLFLIFLLLVGSYPLTEWKKPLSFHAMDIISVTAIGGLFVSIWIGAQFVFFNLIKMLTAWALAQAILTFLFTWVDQALNEKETDVKPVTAGKPRRTMRFPNLFRPFFHVPYRLGSFLLCAGMLSLAVGISGIELYKTERTLFLKPNVPNSFAGYSLTLTNVRTETDENEYIATATVIAQNTAQKTFGLNPSVIVWEQSETTSRSYGQPAVQAAINGDLFIDFLYVTQPVTSNFQAFNVIYYPLVGWFWLGVFAMILAGIIVVGTAAHQIKHGKFSQ